MIHKTQMLLSLSVGTKLQLMHADLSLQLLLLRLRPYAPIAKHANTLILTTHMTQQYILDMIWFISNNGCH
jgi:hypothetical protein